MGERERERDSGRGRERAARPSLIVMGTAGDSQTCRRKLEALLWARNESEQGCQPPLGERNWGSFPGAIASFVRKRSFSSNPNQAMTSCTSALGRGDALAMSTRARARERESE